MASHLLDTHVIVWLAAGNPALGEDAITAIARAQAGHGLAISAISAWELALLHRKRRIGLKMTALDLMSGFAADFDAEPIAIDSAIAAGSVDLPGTLHGDPADRILVATARIHRLTLVTRNEALLAYAAQGHVNVLAV
jgi:PIN domain nuclease of toxin-antitoxin system